MVARLAPIGIIRSTLKTRARAPKQGSEGAPDAWLEVKASVARGLDGITVGDEIIVVTWLHRARRDVLRVHPRSDRRRPPAGVFATRSPDRPNPLGLHRVAVKDVAKNRVLIGPIEAIDGTPVLDIKPVLREDEGSNVHRRGFGRRRGSRGRSPPPGPTDNLRLPDFGLFCVEHIIAAAASPFEIARSRVILDPRIRFIPRLPRATNPWGTMCDRTYRDGNHRRRAGGTCYELSSVPAWAGACHSGSEVAGAPLAN